ncbi:MAG TPA: peptide ABC transporter substrate-binding protein [Chloroflexota bacterium]|nr:peptide ABC transporter substrate-binding protein [Chloroflexota bacterium]
MRNLTRVSRVISFVAIAAMLTLTTAYGSSLRGSQHVAGKVASQAMPVLLSQQETGDADWVQTIDPAVVTDSISISNIWMVYANLVKLSFPSNKPIPDLADHWVESKNHRVWFFHIRNNARFSNGDPVTAQDFVFSISRALAPATKSPVAMLYLGEIVGAPAFNAGKAKTLRGVRALNAHELEINLRDPIAYFLGTLSYPTAEALDPRVVRGHAPASYLTNTCKANVGAGPFEFVCVNGSSQRTSFYPAGHSPYMLFKPNPYYYGPKPHIMVRAPFIADTESNWRLFQAGGIDETGVPTADLAAAQHMKNFMKVAALETDYMTLNSQSPPFNNLNCRLAVAYAFDRNTITEKVLRGTEYPLYDVIPKGMPNGGQGYFGQETDVPYYNPTKAKAYLAACPGHLNGVSLVYQKTSQDLVHEYDTIKFYLSQIGANINLKPLSFNAWLTDVTSPMKSTGTQAAENLWIDDYPDAQDWLQNLLMTGANDNIGGYSNPTYDRLVQQGNVTVNPARRAALYRRAQKLVVNDGGWIGVGGVYNIFVVRPRVHGVVIGGGLIEPVNNNWANVSIH